MIKKWVTNGDCQPLVCDVAIRNWSSLVFKEGTGTLPLGHW
ncbi:hypothetical protein X975_11380, partial [Stegodyphus mimosarum]